MSAAKTKKYVETQVNTASQEQLLLMLFDGGIRFARLGKEHLRAGNSVRAFESLRKSQKIIMEILCALDRSIGDDLYYKLAGLYKFVFLRLAEASLRRSEPLVDEALEIYVHLRQTWAMAVEQHRKEAGPEIPQAPHMQQACVLSIQG